MSDKLEGLSMGCQVEMDVCSICGEHPCDHVLLITPHMSRSKPTGFFEISPTPMTFYATMVPAPKCVKCGNPMGVHAGRDWVCNTSGCLANGFAVPAVLLGVHPAKVE